MQKDTYFSTRFTFDPKREVVWKEIAEYVRRTERTEDAAIAELGAGYCSFINNIRCRKKYAVDLDPESQRYAASDVDFIMSHSDKLSMFSNESIDIILASNLFEHLDRETLKRTIAEIRRVLKTSGKLILIQPNYKYCSKDYFDDYTHQSIFSHISMQDFLQVHGFEIHKCLPRFLPFSMTSRLPKTAFLVRLYLALPFKVLAKQMYIVARKKNPSGYLEESDRHDA